MGTSNCVSHVVVSRELQYIDRFNFIFENRVVVLMIKTRADIAFHQTLDFNGKIPPGIDGADF